MILYSTIYSIYSTIQYIYWEIQYCIVYIILGTVQIGKCRTSFFLENHEKFTQKESHMKIRYFFLVEGIKYKLSLQVRFLNCLDIFIDEKTSFFRFIKVSG